MKAGANSRRQERYESQKNEWGYCYCRDCDRIRYSSDLDTSNHGIVCRKCGGVNLEAPAWVQCPHHMGAAVKCPRAGRGINAGKYGLECSYRCNFRRP